MEDEPLDTGGWWGRRALRLAVLGLCLLGAVALLVQTKTSLFATPSSAAAPECEGRPLPPVDEVGLHELAALRAGLLTAAGEVGGKPYAWGATDTSTVWLDDPPAALSAARLATGRWPAGFEMRRWSATHDDVALGVLEFSNTRQAQRFAAQLSSPRCHRDGVPGTPSDPPNARDLTWINPLGYWQEDLIMPRGRLLYRIAEVRTARKPPETMPIQRARGIRSVVLVACALVNAGCKRERSLAGGDQARRQRLQ